MKAVITFAIIARVIFFEYRDVRAANVYIAGPIVIGGGTFAPSNNVTLSCNSDGTAYSAKSKHLFGSKRYGTGSEYLKIYYIDSPVGTSVTSTSTPYFNFSNWTPL